MMTGIERGDVTLGICQSPSHLQVVSCNALRLWRFWELGRSALPAWRTQHAFSIWVWLVGGHLHQLNGDGDAGLAGRCVLHCSTVYLDEMVEAGQYRARNQVRSTTAYEVNLLPAY